MNLPSFGDLKTSLTIETNLKRLYNWETGSAQLEHSMREVKDDGEKDFSSPSFHRFATRWSLWKCTRTLKTGREKYSSALDSLVFGNGVYICTALFTSNASEIAFGVNEESVHTRF